MRFIPTTVQSFCARRIIDVLALTLIFAGVFTGLALISYNPTDPSFNTASSHISNWSGLLGAKIADLFLQTVGLGAIFFALLPFVWGLRLYFRKKLSFMPMRFALLLASTILVACGLALIPSFGWLTQPSLGGAGGPIVLNSLSAILPTSISAGWGIVFIGLLCAFIGLACAALATGLDRYEWHDVFSSAAHSFSVASQKILNFIHWIRFHNQADYSPRQKVTLKRTRPQRRVTLVESDNEYDDTNEDDEETAEDIAAPIPPRAIAGSIKVVRPAMSKDKAGRDLRQKSFSLPEGEWELPAHDLLQDPPKQADADKVDESGLRKNAEMLQTVLNDYNIKGDIVSIHPGPVVTLYELEPAPGTKSSRVIGLSDDIARSMAAVSVRAAVVPGRNVIGIELPNKRRQTVYLKELLASELYEQSTTKLPLVLGKDIGGQTIIADLARMPHLLVAGTTGSGKSVAINTMILSLVYRLPPEKCRFIMIDPKMLELSVYDDIPHLLTPVVTEPGKAIVALKWAVQEMENRYRAMSKVGVRNIEGYNTRLQEARDNNETLMRKVQTGFDSETGKPVYEEQAIDLTELPYIVVIVDEFADLMLVAGKDVENAIQRLAQMARAAGIHLIMATQRPSVDVITGVIKANFPTRISFQVTSKIDSRTILGDSGAEQLLGMGDMLYMAAGGRITRVHGPFVTDNEVEKVVNHLKAQGEPEYLEDVTEGDGTFGDGGEDDSEGPAIDDLYDKAVALVAREGKASTSFIQRHLQIGYNRAARIIEEMEKQGVVTTANHVGKRDVLVR